MSMPVRAPGGSLAHLSTVATNEFVGGVDDSLVLMTPADDVEGPEVSVVIPAVNEQLTISEFVGWCKEGLESAGLCGEILIVDSSTDQTAELAVQAGARVLKTPKRGPREGLHRRRPLHPGQVRRHGRCRPDVRLPEPRSVRREDAGRIRIRHGVSMGGSIEDGAMPALHRYLGTPVTTWILNRRLQQPLHRHPLRDAGDHTRCPEADGPAPRNRGSTPRRWC